MIQDFTRGIQASTANSLAVKELVERYLGHAIGTIRTDLADFDGHLHKRIDELAKNVEELNLGNLRALGAMQELINRVAVNTNTSNDLANRATKSLREASQRFVTSAARQEAQKENKKDKAQSVWVALWSEFGELSWKHKWRVGAIILLGIASWVGAMPSIVDAIRLLAFGKE